MNRDEVLERLDRMEAETNRQMVLMEGSGQWAIAASHRVDAEVFSTAAELIRAGGWRPIEEAPEGEWLFVGKHTLTGWFTFSSNKAGAISNGYTHYLPEPEPPAREVTNERG